MVTNLFLPCGWTVDRFDFNPMTLPYSMQLNSLSLKFLSMKNYFFFGQFQSTKNVGFIGSINSSLSCYPSSYSLIPTDVSWEICFNTRTV